MPLDHPREFYWPQKQQCCWSEFRFGFFLFSGGGMFCTFGFIYHRPTFLPAVSASFVLSLLHLHVKHICFLLISKCYETWPWILAFLCNIVNDAGNMEQIQQWLVGWYFKEILPPISWNLLLKHHISFILSIWWFHFILVYLENVFFK